MTREIHQLRSRLTAEERDLLEARLRGRAAGGHRAIPRAPRGEPLPLSFAQERLWFLDQLGLGAAYNMAQVMRLSGPLYVDVLRRSLDEIVARHEVLRTTYPEHDGEPRQVIRPPARVPLAVVDLRGAGPDEQNREIRQIAERESGTPFDLTQSPLRVSLARLGEAEHVLFLTLHHVAGDDWSLQILLGELLSHYRALRAGGSPDLPELPIQYADYAVWQRQQGAMLEEQLRYWTRQLEGLSGLNLPLDHARPAVQTSRGASHDFEISADLSARLVAIARANDVTEATLLLAVFQMLLGRYAGQTDVTVGSPVANRSRPELENVVGLFVSTVVMRTDLSGDPTFTELLRRVRQTSLEAQQNQDLPFERLVEALHPERDLSKNPLFQVLFAMMAAPRGGGGAGATADLEVRSYGLDAATTRFDLELNLRVTPGGIAGRFCFNLDLLEPATIERMAGHFRTLLEAIGNDPSSRLSALRILDAEERQRVLVTWNDTETPRPRDTLVHELFEQAAARDVDAVAAVYGNTQLTYGELDDRADALARRLRRCGVGPEVLVGVYLERNLDLIVAMIGVLKAGGAYVPIDPAYPPQRVALMLSDSAAPVVVTQTSLADGLPPSDAVVVAIDDGETAEPEGEAPPAAISAETAAYVIYTSGSTGRPKGVVVTHGNVVNFLESMRLHPGMEASDVMLAVTTLSFDIAALELFLPLVVGARVVIASRELAADGPALARVLAEDEITLMQATPATWQLLVQDGWRGEPRLKMLCGGEALPPTLAAALVDRGRALWNMYGPTETTIWSSTAPIDAKDPVVTLGRPIANTQLYVLDDQLEPVPIGVAGELYIGGAGVARGNRDRPALTATRFVPDPFGTRPGARLYRTGDLVRYRPSGVLDFLGRADHQVKLHGYRIEPGEIEAALQSSDAVRAAAVIPWKSAAESARLVGYVVPAAAGDIDVDALRAFLLERLPHYMVPGVFVPLETLPMTPNGKLDRKSLPAPPSADEAAAPFVAPRTPIEEELATVWQQLLRVERVGVNDSFFQLGGHSLLATRLFSKIRTSFGIDLPLRTIFWTPTVAGLAVQIVQRLIDEVDHE